MLIPNLAVLLAERRLTIARLSRETGLSRTTLTALAGRTARGIQFDTLNTLCQALKVTPGALFVYRPFDLALEVPGLPGDTEVTFVLSRPGAPARSLALACRAGFSPAEGPGALPRLSIRLSPPAEGDAAELIALLRALPASVLADLERDILDAFDRHLDPADIPADYVPDLLWPWQ